MSMCAMPTSPCAYPRPDAMPVKNNQKGTNEEKKEKNKRMKIDFFRIGSAVNFTGASNFIDLILTKVCARLFNQRIATSSQCCER